LILSKIQPFPNDVQLSHFVEKANLAAISISLFFGKGKLGERKMFPSCPYFLVGYRLQQIEAEYIIPPARWILLLL
jgi:hypothetical protein